MKVPVGGIVDPWQGCTVRQVFEEGLLFATPTSDGADTYLVNMPGLLVGACARRLNCEWSQVWHLRRWLGASQTTTSGAWEEYAAWLLVLKAELVYVLSAIHLEEWRLDRVLHGAALCGDGWRVDLNCVPHPHGIPLWEADNANWPDTADSHGALTGEDLLEVNTTGGCVVVANPNPLCGLHIGGSAPMDAWLPLPPGEFRAAAA